MPPKSRSRSSVQPAALVHASSVQAALVPTLKRSKDSCVWHCQQPPSALNRLSREHAPGPHPPNCCLTCILVPCRYRIINQLVDFRYEAARVAEVKRRFLRLDQCIPLDGFLTGWFLGAPVESIRRGNVEDFVAYGFYSRYMHQLPPHVSTSLDLYITLQIHAPASASREHLL